MMRTFLWIISSTIVLFSSCSNPGSSTSDVAINDTSSSEPNSILTRSGILAIGSSACPQGGVTIDLGFDTNGNGVLDTSEITDTYNICNGINGTDGVNGTNGVDGIDGVDGTSGTLVVIQNVTSAATCLYGGKQIQTGTDSNYNGVLDTNEIETTDNFCISLNYLRASYACNAYLTIEGEATNVSTSYRIDEYINGEIEVTGEVITDAFSISKNYHWSPLLNSQSEAWSTALATIYFDMISPADGGRWIFSISRKTTDELYINANLATISIKYNENGADSIPETSDDIVLTWPNEETTLFECVNQ